MQELSAGDAAAFDELQVDVGLAKRGRAVQAGRVFAQRDFDQHSLDLADDLLDRRSGLDGGRCIGLRSPPRYHNASCLRAEVTST
jgi:hypothetical protein